MDKKIYYAFITVSVLFNVIFLFQMYRDKGYQGRGIVYYHGQRAEDIENKLKSVTASNAAIIIRLRESENTVLELTRVERDNETTINDLRSNRDRLERNYSSLSAQNKELRNKLGDTTEELARLKGTITSIGAIVAGQTENIGNIEDILRRIQDRGTVDIEPRKD